MNAERLLQHFDRISEAPDAIPRLRRFILDLAVRGKLVEQDPSDEPAAELLKRIGAAKVQLVKEGKIRKEKSLPAITASDSSFDLPQGWQWVRLGSLSLMTTSGSRDWAQHYSDQGAIFVRMGNLSRDSYILRLDNIQRVCPPENGEGTRTKLEAGDILISITGEVGLLGLIPPNFGDAYINQHTCMVRLASVIRDRFIPEVLRAPFAQNQFNAPQRGIKNSFRLTDVTEMLIPLPPLAEQHRIVAKVDELMALCDQLEAAKTEREQSRDRLVAASLHRLNSPADTVETDAPDLPTQQADAFRNHARFVFNHLPCLTTRVEHIKPLRQTILNLAVRGKLVPQDPNDESVDELLNRVAAERQGFIAKGRLKAQKSFTTVDADPSSQPIPATWRWRRLADLISFGPQNGISPKPTNNTESPKALTLTATTSGFFDASYYKHVDLREVDCQDYWLSAGDVLFQRGNTREYVGIAAVFDGPEKSFVFPDLMIRVRFAEALSLRFIHMTLISPLLRRYFAVEATGASASMPKISQGVLLNAPIPLPPLAAQHRLVTRVDELMALCDQLEAQLAATEADSRRLLEAVLHEVLAPELEETV